MNPTKNAAVKRLDELNLIIKTTRHRLQKAPEGRLASHKRSPGIYYYSLHETPGDSIGSYISKSDLPLLTALAQKDYDQKVLRLAEEEQKKLARFIRTCPDLTPEQGENANIEASWLYDQIMSFITTIKSND